MIDKKSTYEIENLASLLIGAWLLVAPLIGGSIDGYRGANVYIWNFELVGLAVVFLSLIAIKRMVVWAVVLNIVAGVWLILSPLFLIYFHLSDYYFWNSLLSGGLVAFFSALGLPMANGIRYHIHKKTKTDEENSISVLKPKRLHHSV